MNLKKEEFLNSLINGNMIDIIYGYAYKRCFSKDEAEELCQEIITEVIFALSNNSKVSNLNAYIWKIANNTYINHINRNKRIQSCSYSFDDKMSNLNAVYEESMEDEIIGRIVKRERMVVIKQKIASLSEIYRNVMIMYYLEELPVSVIAKRLNIPENRIKQRLYTARNKIRKEVSDLNKIEQSNQLAKLYDLQLNYLGGIGLFKYDSREKINSSLLRKNIIISCRNNAKTVQELSDEFNVRLDIMKDEISRIPEDFLIKTNDEKYIANSIIVDVKLQEKIYKFTADIAKDYFNEIKEYLLSIKDDIMKLPYINPPKSFEYLLWWYLPQFADPLTWAINSKIENKIKEKGLNWEERKIYVFCIMIDPDDKKFVDKSKNHNGIWNVFNMLGMHEEVRIENMSLNNYLPMEKGRFFADQNFNRYPELAMVFKTIDGLDVNSIPENDKEAASKALEKGYIYKLNGKLYPNVTISNETTFDYLDCYRFGTFETEQTNKFKKAIDKYADMAADKLWDCAVKYLPEHLLYLCNFFARGIFCLEYYLLEEGVKDGILYKLPETGCTEGIFATILYPKLMVRYEKSEIKDGLLTNYVIADVMENGIAKKIGLKKGDNMISVNGINWLDFLKDEKQVNAARNTWNEGDVITVERDGKNIDFKVVL